MDRGVCFTSQISGSRLKLDALISLCGLVGAASDAMAELHVLAKDTVALSVRRNRAIHDVWIMDNPEKPERFEASASKVLRIKKIPVTTSYLLALAAEIAAHTAKAGTLCNSIQLAIWARHRASPGTPPLGSGV